MAESTVCTWLVPIQCKVETTFWVEKVFGLPSRKWWCDLVELWFLPLPMLRNVHWCSPEQMQEKSQWPFPSFYSIAVGNHFKNNQQPQGFTTLPRCPPTCPGSIGRTTPCVISPCCWQVLDWVLRFGFCIIFSLQNPRSIPPQAFQQMLPMRLGPQICLVPSWCAFMAQEFAFGDVGSVC